MPILPSKRTLYTTPFSAAYWRDAAAELRSPRTLVFSALMVAACAALAPDSIHPCYWNGARNLGLPGRSLCALVGGPLNALLFGFVEDNLSFLLHPSGAYFPGYTLTTMLGNLTYALFLYRARITVARVFLAKLLTNVQNVLLGTLWSAFLAGKLEQYWMLAGASAVKNAVMLPVQTIMLVALFGALIPVLSRTGLLYTGEQRRLAVF